MPATVKFNDKAFIELAVGPEVRAACMAEVAKAKAIAEALAAEFTDTGDYASSFDTEDVTVVGIGREPRGGARLVNSSNHATAVELGPYKTTVTGHRVLGRTLEALGGAP